MELEILQARTSKPLVTLSGQPGSATVGEIKKNIGRSKAKFADINRLELRSEAKGKGLKDDASLESLGLAGGGKVVLYFKDRGVQIGWTTVFLAEYAGPLFVYLLFYLRPSLIYGPTASSQEICQATHLAAAAWSFHYGKRLLETVFVHRFSNATMPLTNLFKNCSYYWGFAAYIAYHINHPLYTSPSTAQVIIGLSLFLLCELGNFTIHLLLRDLRPPGTRERRIPFANSNPLSGLQELVSCPNYTYEVLAWLCFSLMTQCLPAGLFTLAGAYQMTLWALGKHRNYKREFPNYPRRKAIFPFII